MFSGVSGLAAQSQAMGMIADNITNVNTIGFKKSLAKLSTQVTSQATGANYAPGGVMSRPYQNVSAQGLLQSSASPTDIAMSGEGFFVVNDTAAATGTYSFTRAGSFAADENGDLRNAAGFFLQGVQVPPSGVVPAVPAVVNALATVNIFNLTNSWQATTTGSAQINLQSTQAVGGAYVAGNLASGAVTPHFSSDLQIYDSQGAARTITLGFYKTAVNTWAAEIYGDTNGTPATRELIANGNIVFNADGTLNTMPAALTTINIAWAAALGITTPQTIALDLGTVNQADGLSQSAGAYQLISSQVDGAVLGSLSGVTISEDGIVSSLFTNGTSRPIYKLAVATFRNADGLTSRSGNAWTQSDASGNYTLKDAGTQGAGKVSSGALEASTVDLAQEFSNMIVTQRAYSASGKIITTADEMLDELIRLKR
jgi:flagellar hook protein FlgE